MDRGRRVMKKLATVIEAIGVIALFLGMMAWDSDNVLVAAIITFGGLGIALAGWRFGELWV